MSSKKITENSLRKTFLKRFFWVMLLGWTVIGAAIYWITRHELDELYDGEMAQVAHVLLGIYSDQQLMPGPEPRVSSSPFEGGENYEHKLAFQIWNRNGVLLLRSSNAPLDALTTQTGVFQTDTIFNSRLRTLAIPSPDGELIVHVAQNLDIRQENANDILELLIYVLILAFPLLMWLINSGITQGTRPLYALSQKIAHRSEHDLTAIETADVPAEIQDIILALNKLMARVKQALSRERQFISDAAHELRTPLSGIKTHAQLAIRDESRRLSSLERIVSGVDRTTRLANQLLTLSGIDALTTLKDVSSIDVAPLIVTVIEDLNSDIQAKSIQIQHQFDRSSTIKGDEDLLYILLRNLIDNAIRHSPQGGIIQIRYSALSGHAVIAVVDQGPGIPDALRDRVFDRFFRDIEQHAQGETRGSGLGLAIAAKIARLHQAEIKLDIADPGPGLSATIIFSVKTI